MSETRPSYLDLPLSVYLADAASRQPTPGGGSVAALAGALATTMATMAANFTTGKEKFKAVEPRVLKDLESLGAAREKFLELMHRDMAAYGAVMAAYKLPKESPAEQLARQAAVQETLGRSLQVPLETGRVALEVLAVTEELASIANSNLLSDVAVAAILAAATWESSRVNAEVNLRSIIDANLVVAARRELADGQAAAERLKASCLAAIAARG